jgi:hypothetical protein
LVSCAFAGGSNATGTAAEVVGRFAWGGERFRAVLDGGFGVFGCAGGFAAFCKVVYASFGDS